MWVLVYSPLGALLIALLSERWNVIKQKKVKKKLDRLIYLNIYIQFRVLQLSLIKLRNFRGVSGKMRKFERN